MIARIARLTALVIALMLVPPLAAVAFHDDETPLLFAGETDEPLAHGDTLSYWDTASEALVRLDRTRELVSTTKLADAVRAAAELAEVDLDEGLAPAPVAPPPSVPAGLAEPVGRLLGAIRIAETLVKGSADPADLIRLEETTARLEEELRHTLAALDVDREARRRLERLIREGEALGEEIAQAVDRPALHSAALLLTRAIDETLPLLSSYASALPPSDARVDGCDVTDVPGVLCIGGEGANTYTDDHALLIDLGGDDVHANSAGGADPLGNGLFVSVTIDLAGNDRYATEVPTDSGARVVQGSAIAQGIGILVDVEGDDEYSAIATGPDTDPQPQGVIAQGVGRAGVGILADLEGDDSYRVANLSHRAIPADPDLFFFISPRNAEGFGRAIVGGTGLFLDWGGDDTYLLESRPELVVQEGKVRPGVALAQGFGNASSRAVAIFFDGGGEDSIRMAAASAPVSPNEARPFSPEPPEAGAEGFGRASLGGTGLALSGEGPTTWSVESSVSAPESFGSFVQGFGFAVSQAFGALDDAGGDDLYLAEATNHALRRAVVDDSCPECPAPEAEVRGGFAVIQAQGSGAGTGIGLLRDGGGNDTYRTRSTAVAEAEAIDARTEPPTDGPGESAAARASAETRAANSTSQGAGINFSPSFLIDLDGDDTYECVSTNEAKAQASSPSPEEDSARAVSGLAICSVQASSTFGPGHGALLDLGGTDVYRAISSSTAAASPETEVVAGDSVTAAQAAVWNGSGGALLLDIGGDGDTFVSEPENPACMGTRGEDVWVDCGSPAAIGINRQEGSGLDRLGAPSAFPYLPDATAGDRRR